MKLYSLDQVLVWSILSFLSGFAITIMVMTFIWWKGLGADVKLMLQSQRRIESWTAGQKAFQIMRKARAKMNLIQDVLNAEDLDLLHIFDENNDASERE